MAIFLSRQRGLTLVELLVSIVSVVLVFGAASGLALAAIARQKIELDASRLEARHGELAQAIFQAIKTADSLQIFASGQTAEMSSLGWYRAGVPIGDYLSCRQNLIVDNQKAGLIETDFEFFPGSSNGVGTLIQTVRFLSTGRQQIRREFSGVSTAEPIFSMKNGIPQAHWSIFTALDRADFNVYAMPLSMR
jgi:type II secretory pathway pseudopilin PulG